MKKLLFLVLIAIAVCSSFETDPELEAFDWESLKTIWNKVKNVYEKAVEFLKKYDLYYPIINALKKNLPAKAEELCTSKGVPAGVCRQIVKFLLDFLK